MPEEFETAMDHVVAVESNVENIRQHVEMMNDEIGELRDEQRKQNDLLTSVRIDLADVKSNLSWLKKTYWIVVTTTIGALVTGLVNLWK